MKHACVTAAFMILLSTLACLPIHSQAGAADKPNSESVDDLLRNDKYAQVKKTDDDPHQLAAWAFAQYHLAPSRDASIYEDGLYDVKADQSLRESWAWIAQAPFIADKLGHGQRTEQAREIDPFSLKIK